MALSAGDSLGPYEILSALGAGGMGEVYRARDRKLSRDVALKILPSHVSADPDRIARFEREARVLASLNHSNIGHIYGLEDSTSVRALVLELIEGPTLDDRIARGPMRLDEALAIAWQIADAIAAAHALGVVHRDLKPANVKVRPDGTVKVLDFGLAKALEPVDPENAAATATAPLASPGDTVRGDIIGTAAYMSPEQARGEPLDTRTDIWAFGVVLYEMLTGQRLFARRTSTDSLAAVLHVEPDINRVPAPVRPLIEACLQKDPKRRLRDIGDARLLVRDADGSSTVASPIRRAWLPWVAAAAFATIAAVAVWSPWRRDPPEAPAVRFQIVPPGELPTSGASAISPDGRYLAYLLTGSDGVLRVWVRDLQTLEDRPLQGTEIRQAAPPPFWSPDSRFIAYDAGGALMKVEVAGGLPLKICDLALPAIGGSWNRDGVILIGNVVRGIQRVSEGGGTPADVTVPDRTHGQQSHLTPVFLPDGRHFFYLRASRTDPAQAGIFLGSLEAAPDRQDSTRLLATTTSAAYARAADGGVGHLLFLRDGKLMAQAFDERQLALSGDPVLVAEGVHSYLDTATLSVSDTGVLAYQPASVQSQLTWFDRDGKPIGRHQERGLFSGIVLSPDGGRALAVRINPQATSSTALWVLDFASRPSTRVSGGAAGSSAVWSPDGRRIVFSSNVGGFETTLMQRSISPDLGPEEALFQPGGNRVSPTSWSRDGTRLMYVVVDPRTNSDLWVLSMDGAPKATPFLISEAVESQAQFAPAADGPPRWVAFTTNESGRDEVQIRTFPDAGSPQVVSRGGGHSPKWRGDGKELFYIAADGMVTAVPVTRPGEPPGPPMALFRSPAGSARPDATGRRSAMSWDVSPDGQRFLFAAPSGAGSSSAFTVVLNWRRGIGK